MIKITEAELKEILTKHKLWTRTGHQKGEKADLSGADLSGFDLHGENLIHADLSGARLNGANLSGAKLNWAKLSGAYLYGADLSGTRLLQANLAEANLTEAKLNGAKLFQSKLTKAILEKTKFHGAKITGSDLSSANFHEADLTEAELYKANLKRSNLYKTNLRGADFSYTVVDGETSFINCHIDTQTDFTGVGLDNARLEPGLKQRLEYNIRRKRWESWYENNPWWKSIPVKWFWELSDYGMSTGRIIGSFVLLSFMFSMIYWVAAACPCPPSFNPESCECTLYAWADTNTYEVPNTSCDSRGLIKDLLYGKEASALPAFCRSLYFSIVTMTTLGFGDMHAIPGSIIGYLVLSIQVILGYVLLGALITRLAILFTSDGPAKDFSKKTDESNP